MEKPVDVVVVGAGPVGLLAAIELALGGIGVLVLERLAAASMTMKAGGIGPLGIEALDWRKRSGAGFELEGAEFKPMLTDDRGLITVQPDFDIGKTINNLWTGSRVKLAGWRVRVSAPGYVPCTSPLFEFTGDQIDTDSPRLIPAEHRRAGTDQEKGRRGIQLVRGQSVLSVTLWIGKRLVYRASGHDPSPGYRGG